MIVSGLFLDVKSAFPSVNYTRLWHTLKQKNCPVYLRKLIIAFLTDRSTRLRLQDFVSQSFDIGDGLPQGSPLSPILYILYNSSPLLPSDLSPDTNQFSIGFIDDVTHLVATRDVHENISQLEIIGAQLFEWGRKHGAIFDKRKAQLMHFTHRRHENPPLTFGSFTLQPQETARWLGIWLDPKLTFSHHLKKVREKGLQTLSQL